MIGTFTNVLAIIIGSIAGGLFKKGLSDKYKTPLMQAMGLSAVAIGVNSFAKAMPQSQVPILFIVSLALGTLLGSFLNLDDNSKKLIGKLKFKNENTAEGITTAILLFCVGTLSILGPIEASINKNYTYLFTNSTLDLITSMVLASNFGFGVIISAGVLFLWQGGIYLFASSLNGFLTPELMCEISIIGGILIFATGLNILNIVKIKTINLLPALLVPILYFLIF